MADIISPPDFRRIRERSREEQILAGLEGEIEARRQADENYLIILQENDVLEEQYKLLNEKLNTREAELNMWRSKSIEWKSIAKRRRTINRRERRNNRVLLIIIFFIALALLIAVGFIAMQSENAVQNILNIIHST